MKKIISLILSVVIIVSIFVSCGKKEEGNTNSADKITQYINEHPYFNPYNTIIDCESDYYYCVMNKMNSQKNYGLLGGIYRNSFNDPEMNHIWNPLYQNQTDDIVSLAVNDTYIFFLKSSERNKLFRIDKATGANFKEIAINISDEEEAKSVRCVNDLIFIDLTDKYIILTSNGDDYIIIDDYTEENGVYHRRTPWSELLSGDWSVTTATKDKSEGTISVKHGDKEYLISSNSNFLIDYPKQTIYYTYTEGKGSKIVSMDMNGNVLKEFNIEENVIFKNVSMGILCGFTDKDDLYLFNTSDESKKTLDISSVNYGLYDFIDIFDETMTVYLMNTDNKTVNWLYGFADTKAEVVGQ